VLRQAAELRRRALRGGTLLLRKETIVADTYTRRREFARTVLRQAQGKPVTYAELAARGIDNPGQAVYELELEGEAVMHTAGGVALAPGSIAPLPEGAPH